MGTDAALAASAPPEPSEPPAPPAPSTPAAPAAVRPEPVVSFETDPTRYRHWHLAFDGPVATLTMAVDPTGGLRDDYELKLNSYDLGVDIELHDAVERLRFEHPEIRAVVVTGGLDKVFCAGANIQMLAGASHGHKVNFCKFTNETRASIEDATAHSGQTWIAAVNGTAAGGGYELALACDEIILIDDRASTVSLPEVPLLAVLPGTGGLTRVVDKRHVRRDLADVFATRTEGIKGEQAVKWKLVDRVVPRSGFDGAVRERALARAATSDRPEPGTGTPGIVLHPLKCTVEPNAISYEHVSVRIDRSLGCAHVTVRGPHDDQPLDPNGLAERGDGAWIIAAARQLDDAICHLRIDEPEIGTWVLRSTGEARAVLDAERLLAEHAGDWLVREVSLLWTRTLSRLDLSARTVIALVEPGSCFAGVLAEIVLAADRSFMLGGEWVDDQQSDARADSTDANAKIQFGAANDGRHPMINGLSRLATRFWGRDDELALARGLLGRDLDANDAIDAGLVTFAPDGFDWDDEIRVTLEERASFSPDALTGLEANLRFPGPETMDTKIFARLTAWQNWIFQRPNAVGPNGALRAFGSGSRPDYDRRRV